MIRYNVYPCRVNATLDLMKLERLLLTVMMDQMKTLALAKVIIFSRRELGHF